MKREKSNSLSEERRVKNEKSNGLSEDTARKECWAKPNQTSCSRFAQSSLHPSLLFSCSLVLIFRSEKWRVKNPIVPLWFLKWYAPKGQKLLAQGSALGVIHPKAKAPCKGKSVHYCNAVALTGRFVWFCIRLPRARSNLGFAFPLRAGDLWFSPHY